MPLFTGWLGKQELWRPFSHAQMICIPIACVDSSAATALSSFIWSSGGCPSASATSPILLISSSPDLESFTFHSCLRHREPWSVFSSLHPGTCGENNSAQHNPGVQLVSSHQNAQQGDLKPGQPDHSPDSARYKQHSRTMAANCHSHTECTSWLPAPPTSPDPWAPCTKMLHGLIELDLRPKLGQVQGSTWPA